MRPACLVVLAVALAPARGLAAEPCQVPVRPGRSIGEVRLGMTAAEAAATATFVAPAKDEAPVWRTLSPGGPMSFRLGKDKRVEEIRLETSMPCFVTSREWTVDLTTVESQNWAPFADCGGQVTAALTGWACREHGVDVLWDGPRHAVVVRRPSPMRPYNQSPPPIPKLPQAPIKPKVPTPKPSVDAGVVAAGDAGVLDAGPRPEGGGCDAGTAEVAEPPPDPCNRNWAPMAKLACGFFGRGEALALECYPVQLCMGTFAKDAASHVELHGAGGESLGAFELGRAGRSLVYRFGRAVPTGTPVRIYFDRNVKILPPASSYLGPNAPTDPEKDPKVVGKPMAAVVGSREVPSGWVLDLVVPASATSTGSLVGTVEKKAKTP